MEETCIQLFNFVYGDLIPIESKKYGKICYVFYDEYVNKQIVYYPSTKEIYLLREKEHEFSIFVPLYLEDFKKYLSSWMNIKYGNEINFKGLEYVEFQ